MLKNRILLSPIFIFWWLIQLIIFSGIGGIISLFFGSMGLFFNLFFKENDNKMFLLYMFGWVIGPFVWWYRYFKYGKIKILKEFRNLLNNKELGEEELNEEDEDYYL
jgi:hypothetical protein